MNAKDLLLTPEEITLAIISIPDIQGYAQTKSDEEESLARAATLKAVKEIKNAWIELVKTEKQKSSLPEALLNAGITFNLKISALIKELEDGNAK